MLILNIKLTNIKIMCKSSIKFKNNFFSLFIVIDYNLPINFNNSAIFKLKINNFMTKFHNFILQ